MTNDNKIKEKKPLQHGIKREVAKISVLSFVKFDKHEYLTGEKTLT